MKKLFFAAGFFLLFLFLIGGYAVSRYNFLTELDIGRESAWAEVENQLKRRADLIPNLVETVKGYAAHEKSIYENIADARSRLMGAMGKGNISDAVNANTELSGALSRLLMVVENYPQLKADTSFIRLQDELAGTENRMAVARQRYNQTVTVYNFRLRRFPDSFFASFFRFEKAAFFEVTELERQTPQVKF